MRDPEALCVMLTMGVDDGGRKAALAFGVALAAVANGTRVHVFLSLESVLIGTPSGAAGLRPRGFSESLDEYVRHFLELGGKLEVCSSCYEEYCRHLPKDETGKPLLRSGTVVETLSVIAGRASEMPVISF